MVKLTLAAEESPDGVWVAVISRRKGCPPRDTADGKPAITPSWCRVRPEGRAPPDTEKERSATADSARICNQTHLEVSKCLPQMGSLTLGFR